MMATKSAFARLYLYRHLKKTVVSLLLAAFFVWGPMLFLEEATFHRWDNVEYFVPVIKWVHSQWLQGNFPAVNLAQHLGEPFSANVQAGYFYLPYTFAVALQILLNASDASLAAIIVFLHLAIGIYGFYHLARFYQLPHHFSWAMAAVAVASAYNISYAGVWINVPVVMAWMPWCLLGLLIFRKSSAQVIFNPKVFFNSGALLFSLSMGMIGNAGHPQFWFYAQLFIVISAFGVLLKSPKLMVCWLIYVLISVALAMPTLLPLIEYLPQTTRSGVFNLDEFLALSAEWHEIAGFLSPWTGYGTEALPPASISMLTFQGVHVAIFSMISLCFLLRKKDPTQTKESLDGWLWFLLLLLCVVLALGGRTLIYPATYGLPVWSSFRWPSKFLLFVQLFVGVYVIWVLKTFLNTKTNQWIVIGLCLLTAAGVLFMWGVHHLRLGNEWKSSEIILLTLNLFIIFCISKSKESMKWQYMLSSALVFSAFLFVLMVHQQKMKPYEYDYRHTFYGFSPDYRVMPTSVDDDRDIFRLSPLNLGMTATVQGYVSMSGYPTSLTPVAYTKIIESYLFGGLARHWIANALDGSFLDFLGVRYVIAHNPDDLNLLASNVNFSPIYRSGDVYIFENKNTMPLVFFAKESYYGPVNWKESAPVVQSSEFPLKKWSTGVLERYEYQLDGGIEAAGYVSNPALLVTSTLALPGWRVSVNGGDWEKPSVVNENFLAVPLPEGRFHVRWSYFPPGLLLGLYIASFGIFCLIILRLLKICF